MSQSSTSSSFGKPRATARENTPPEPDKVRQAIDIWIKFLRRRIPQVHACVVLLDGNQNSYRWSEQDIGGDGLVAVAGLARRSAAPVTSSEKDHVAVAVKIPYQDDGLGSIAIAISPQANNISRISQTLSEASEWLADFYVHAVGLPAAQNSDLVWFEPLLGRGTLRTRVASMCSLLAKTVQVDRVAIGVRSFRGVKLLGVSGDRVFATRSPLSHRLINSMRESAKHWHKGEQLTPNWSDHGATLQLPLMIGRDVFGIVSLERHNSQRFTEQETTELVRLSHVLSHLMSLALRADRDPFYRMGQIGGTLLPKTRAKKFISAAVLTVAILIALLPMPHRVTTSANIEGELQRSLVAPMDTYLEEVMVVAGEQVKAAQVLATFATEDLSLELLKWQSERARLQKGKRDSAARQERAKLRVLEAEIAQANAEIALVESKIKRRELRAPVDGIIVSGDLTQRLGAPVERGEVLFEIVPGGEHQVMLLTDEQDVKSITVGMSGTLKLNAFPRDVLEFEIFRVTPVNKITNEGNYFLAYGALKPSLLTVRPGMHGVAKVTVGSRPAIVNWSESLRRWVSLKLWRWFG